MALANVSCASRLMDPRDMAPVAKRLTISWAGSTSSRGTDREGSNLNFSWPRRVTFMFCSLVRRANSL